MTLKPFPTDNPYLRKLFSMKEFGRAPGKSVKVFRDRVIDPEERMLAAFRSQHGVMRWGYVYLTTHYVRWIQVAPTKDDDMFQYTDRLDMDWPIIRFPSGDQFQVRGFGAARKFKGLYRVAQQASLWEPR